CPQPPHRSIHTTHRGQSTPHLPQKNTARRSAPCRRRSPEIAPALRPLESSGSASPLPSPSFRGIAATRRQPRGPALRAPSAAPPPRPPGRPSSRTAAPPMPQIKFSQCVHQRLTRNNAAILRHRSTVGAAEVCPASATFLPVISSITRSALSRQTSPRTSSEVFSLQLEESFRSEEHTSE